MESKLLHRVSIGLIALALLIASSQLIRSDAWGASYRHTFRRGYPAQRRQPPPAKPKKKTKPTTRPQPTAAQLSLEDAQATLDALTSKLWAAYYASPDWIAADKAVTSAQSAYDAACQPIRDRVANGADYQKAAQDKKDAEAALDALAPDATAQQRQDLANHAMKAGQVMSKLEADALAADPAIAAARTELTAATTARATLKDQDAAALKADPKWVAAKKAVDDAAAKINASATKSKA